ncbi:hypothetical protein MF408_06150 [Nocardioides sp. TF02-7]|nr:hypothetical protein [Nocardioides sp. TF02-7]UMG93740.1 hypothetical protein MF408_06150 [Nocardioides sp. TF02-7]
MTVPARGQRVVPLTVTRAVDAAGGELEVELRAFGSVSETASTRVFVRHLDCTADVTEEACLDPRVELIHNFEDGTDGWTAAEGSASVAAVTSTANGPGIARLGRRLLEATPTPGIAANEWRTASVRLDQPRAFTPDQALVVHLNGYGGGSGPFFGRLRVTDSTGTVLEVEQGVTPDAWNQLRAPLGDWEGIDVAAIEVGFRGLPPGRGPAGSRSTWSPSTRPRRLPTRPTTWRPGAGHRPGHHRLLLLGPGEPRRRPPDEHRGVTRLHQRPAAELARRGGVGAGRPRLRPGGRAGLAVAPYPHRGRAGRQRRCGLPGGVPGRALRRRRDLDDGGLLHRAGLRRLHRDRVRRRGLGPLPARARHTARPGSAGRGGQRPVPAAARGAGGVPAGRLTRYGASRSTTQAPLPSRR